MPGGGVTTGEEYRDQLEKKGWGGVTPGRDLHDSVEGLARATRNQMDKEAAMDRALNPLGSDDPPAAVMEAFGTFLRFLKDRFSDEAPNTRNEPGGPDDNPGPGRPGGRRETVPRPGEPAGLPSGGQGETGAVDTSLPSRPPLINNVQETVELLAASYVADGKSIPDAARLAVEQLVTRDKDLVEELRAERALGQRSSAVGRTTDLAAAGADPFGQTESDAVAPDDLRIDARLDVRDEGSNGRRAGPGAIKGSPVAQSGLSPTPKPKLIVPPRPKLRPPSPSEIKPLTPAELNALRGPVALTPSNDPLPQSHIALQFRNMIAARESRDRGYQSFNPGDGGAWGRYQLTKKGREQIGLESTKGKLTGKYDVQNIQDFMNDPIAQERAFLDYILDNAEQLRKNRTVDFIGQEIDGIAAKFTITMDGLVAAAHRWGAKGTKTYLLHLQKHGWKSDASTFPGGEEGEAKFKAIETRLREFENISYLKVR